MGDVYHEVVVTNNDQALAFAKKWCVEKGYPKASITFVRLEINDRIFSVRDPDLEMTLEIKVDIFGAVVQISR